MNTHLTPDELAIYAEYLSGKEKRISQLIINHVEECDECAMEALDLNQVLEDADFPKLQKFRKITNSSFVYISVAASIILLFSIWLFNDFKNDNENSIVSLSSKNIPQKNFYANISDSANKIFDNNKMISSINTQKFNFQTNENLENIFLRYHKNYKTGDIVIVTLSEIKAEMNKQVILKWNNPNKQKLTIEIFDNKQNLLETEILTNNSYHLKKNNIAGLFYWKLLNENNEIIFCGKIIRE